MKVNIPNIGKWAEKNRKWSETLNRLVDSDHKVYDTNAWGDSTSYEERGITYDLNGNIKTLKRTSRFSTASTSDESNLVNNFTYNYSGTNQLKSMQWSAGWTRSSIPFRSGIRTYG